MKISELIAALVRVAAENGDLMVMQGAKDDLVYPLGPEIRIESAQVGSVVVLR